MRKHYPETIGNPSQPVFMKKGRPEERTGEIMDNTLPKTQATPESNRQCEKTKGGILETTARRKNKRGVNERETRVGSGQKSKSEDGGESTRRG